MAQNDGTPLSLTVADVPVGAFWSVTIHNPEGYLEPNDAGIYSFNSVTAEPNADWSFTINFGGCGDGRINCIPVPKDWNYVARLYDPAPEILDGSWSFPVPEPVR